MSNQDITTHKFAAVLNKKAEIGKVLNALGHISLGLVASATEQEQKDMAFISYKDKDGGEYLDLSSNSFIILRADNSNQIRTLRKSCIEKGIHFVVITAEMQVGTFQEQLDKIKTLAEEELEYVGIVMFGTIPEVSDLTKKFRLWY